MLVINRSSDVADRLEIAATPEVTPATKISTTAKVASAEVAATV